MQSHEENGNDSPNTIRPPSPGNHNIVVGIGASAGGIQALQQFFRNVPAETGIAYVVILHLSPDHDSKLAEVLQSASKIPIMQVFQKVQIKPDHVYVVPPNKHLTMENDHIVVSPNLEMGDRHAPVDIFFRSLAMAYGHNAVCVVLSGTGANGSMGLKRVKELGGAAFVQNPKEAEFNEMPRNSIATELVDDVLPVAEIPGKILSYVNSRELVSVAHEPEQPPAEHQHALREIFSQLRLRTTHDFSNYKKPTLLRRIERRIRVHSLPDLPSYSEFLLNNPEESHSLLKDLLISVTNFFRDANAFQVIENEVLPNIIKRKNADEAVRIWVAGCATGEEAYSLAMLCAEQTENVADAPRIQIFATDIDYAAIEQAREGLYTINDAADVSPERLRNFFRREGNEFRIRRDIREMILFANHNFIKDPPFSHLDLISCRNVLIYLNHSAQERVMETFHFALNRGGFLFLGASETADSASDLYTVHNREHHVYRNREVGGKTYPLPETIPMLTVSKNVQSEPSLEKEERGFTRFTNIDLHHKLLEKYAPPSLVLNQEYKIIHVSQKAGRYLEIQGGDLSSNLLNLIKPELRLELRSALYQATQNNTDIEARGIQATIDNVLHTVNIHVRPVLNKGTAEQGYILVVFEETNSSEPTNTLLVTGDDSVARHLENELIRLKERLRSSTEQHEFQAEELKAANEELQAMNEETRSAAEELETSKEELQSINEELRTVNQELKVKVEETTLASNNLRNLINSVDLATVFLDRMLRVNLFSPAACDIFKLIPADNGRLLSDITSTLTYNNLSVDAELVLSKLQPIEREVSSVDGKIYLMRVLPYRTDEDRINGVVITFFDITKRNHTERELKASEERLRLLIESAKDYAIFTQDIHRRVDTWNKGAELMFGYRENEILGQSADIFFVPEDRSKGAPEQEVQKAISTGSAENERWHLRRNGTRFYGSGMVRPVFDQSKKLIGVVKIMRDLTENKKAQEALSESEERLRITMNSATDYAIITLDINGNIIGWSKGAELIFGYEEAEVRGRSTDLIFTAEDRAAGAPRKEMETAVEEGRANDERWHERKDKSVFYMSGVMTPIMDNARLAGFVKVARDMTDRKLVEQQKDEFIGIASHELKTPVTSIKAYSELLLGATFDKETSEQSDLIIKLDNQVNRLIDLINALLDTTRIAEARLDLNTTAFDMNGLIEDRIREIQSLAKNHKLIFKKGKIEKVHADRERIGQVITNLLSNAIKYSPEGGDVIITSTTAGSAVEVTVRDFGIGIPGDLTTKVFERFFRVPQQQVTTYPGMGLGLYIAAGIMKMHGGSIAVESDEGGGALFRFTLPFRS